MVNAPGDYPWSSYRTNALGIADPVVTPHTLHRALAPADEVRLVAYRELFEEELDPDLLRRLRNGTNGGFVLGSGKFEQQVAAMLGRRTWKGSPGRPRKKSQWEARGTCHLENVVCPWFPYAIIDALPDGVRKFPRISLPERFAEFLAVDFFAIHIAIDPVPAEALTPMFSGDKREAAFCAKCRVVFGIRLNYLLEATCSRRSASHTLITDWRVTPKRPASRSRDSIIQVGKSTLTRHCS